MAYSETVLFYADNYGSRSLDIEVAVEIQGRSYADVQRAKKQMRKQFLAFFKADRTYKKKPLADLRWHESVADSRRVRSNKRGFSGLDARSRTGKSIDPLKAKMSDALKRYFKQKGKRTASDETEGEP